MSDLLFVHERNPVHRVTGTFKSKLIRAQRNHADHEFSSAGALLMRAFDELKLNVPVPDEFRERHVSDIADMVFPELAQLIGKLLRQVKVPEEAISPQARTVAQRIHLLRAFEDPDAVLATVIGKVTGIVGNFPRSAKDIEQGKNPGDVVDPYILAATQILLHGGDYPSTIATTVGHKAVMKIEDLLGHLHEDVIGEVRGNVRVPEPRGGFRQNEILDLEINPFPGADIVQPPHEEGGALRFHQVKSKTGSAKGGDGKRLGTQLKNLQDYYGGEIFYDALIGRTLTGHRSRGAVEKAAPNVIVLVGEAAFHELTRSRIGPQLLLRLYQAAFLQVATASGYRVEAMTEIIVAAFAARAERSEGGIIETILADVIKATPEEQDSRLQDRSKKKPRTNKQIRD